MEILKEFRQRIGRENIIITLWDNESIDIEYGGVTMSFKSLWQLEGFINLLGMDILGQMKLEIFKMILR